ncbi:hypothetical protein WOLCODRAFT_144845 [Wolfiporia cocos MD-104 SS10]|uniref:Efficient mitochondria targeting-associated protein 19 n=1 Tax=Wolfiporia cocos (strain MD-104) TaxID=742152 RepID=A0A2H3K531_WOLCO|nr:hypothetical protein WOLCODRAFT_144845 [Wolfiporia cocos MD-104 SS10]
MSRLPLTSRPLDLLYFAFFLMHATATVLVDLQVVYPPALVPQFMKEITQYYMATYNDPLIGGVMGFFGNSDSFVWFKTFILMEGFFQLPVFILGMRGLWRDSRSIYVLLLIYAASASTTTLPCVAVILTTPLTSAETLAAKIISITPVQRTGLLASYIPFFALPLIMTVDMAFRVLKLVHVGASAQAAAKSK